MHIYFYLLSFNLHCHISAVEKGFFFKEPTHCFANSLDIFICKFLFAFWNVSILHNEGDCICFFCKSLSNDLLIEHNPSASQKFKLNRNLHPVMNISGPSPWTQLRWEWWPWSCTSSPTSRWPSTTRWPGSGWPRTFISSSPCPSKVTSATQSGISNFFSQQNFALFW